MGGAGGAVAEYVFDCSSASGAVALSLVSAKALTSCPRSAGRLTRQARLGDIHHGRPAHRRHAPHARPSFIDPFHHRARRTRHRLHRLGLARRQSMRRDRNDPNRERACGASRAQERASESAQCAEGLLWEWAFQKGERVVGRAVWRGARRRLAVVAVRAGWGSCNVEPGAA